MQPKFCKFKEALGCWEFLKTISKRIYVRGGRFQLLFLSINKRLKSFLKLHTRWNRMKVIFKSRALVLGVFAFRKTLKTIAAKNCFSLKKIILRFHRKRKT